MGAGLATVPNTLLFLLLTKPTQEHWIRLLGISAVVLGSYYIVAGRHELLPIARASLWAHTFMIVAFSMSEPVPSTLSVRTTFMSTLTMTTALGVRFGTTARRLA